VPTGRQEDVIEKKDDDPWEQLGKETLVVREEQYHVQTVDLMVAVSQFCHYYPGEFRDGEIGWRRFWLLYNEIPRIGAALRWNITESVKTGYGLWEGDDNARKTLKRLHNSDFKLANGE